VVLRGGGDVVCEVGGGGEVHCAFYAEGVRGGGCVVLLEGGRRAELAGAVMAGVGWD